MAIAKRPLRNQKDASGPASEKAANAFIEGAGRTVGEGQTDTRKVPAMIRFDRELLERVDAAAKRRGVSRSAWVQYTLSKALDSGEG
jgi:predicted HicB family RNase H-like nuclease